MKALKRLGSFLLALVMVLSMIPATHTHAAEVTSGYCGDPDTNGGKDVSWTFQDGVLTISGTGKTNEYGSIGEMYGVPYGHDHISTPWTETAVTSLVVEEGVTHILGLLSWGAYNLTDVSLPDSLKVIGHCSFEDCDSLTSITIPKNVTSIWSGAFWACENLTSITFTGDAPSINDYAFNDAVTATCYYPASANWPADKLKNYGGNLTWVAYDACADGHNFGTDDVCTGCGILGGSCGSDLIWTLDDAGNLTITGTGSMEDYNFGSSPFYKYADKITSVSLPEGLTSIGERAFDATFPNLDHIEIPTSVTHIQDCAFGATYNKVKLKYVGTMAQWDSIYIDAISSYGLQYGAECSDGTIVYMGPCGGSTGLYDSVKYMLLGDGTLKITGTGAMKFYQYLNYESCFSGDDKITKVVIDEGVTSIAGYAFKNCTNLTEVHIPASVTSISYNVFQGCTALTDVYYGSNEKNWNKMSISSDSNEPLAAATIHYTDLCAGGHSWVDATCVAPKTCSVCGETEGEAIPTAHTWVEANCTYAKTCSTCNITEGDAILDAHVFEGGVCKYCGLQGGTCGENAWWKLVDGVLTIYGSGEMTSAPWPKASITTAIIEEGITSICEGAFEDCEKMTAVSIPNTVTTLGSSCFDGCEMLASVDLPEGITAIPSSAFAYCWALTGIKIPESVTSIGYKAFAYCREMVGMQIPEKVTSIGGDAFTGCSKLKFVRFNGNAPTLGSYAFRSLTLKAFYPGYDTTWTADVRTSYGGSVTWVAYDQNHLEHSFDSNGICSCGCIGGTCGQNAQWALDPATGTLYISGTGKMEDYGSSSQTPWANYKDAVRKVVVEEGITHIGGCAFKEFSNLEAVSLPDSLTSIGSEAIMLCPKLKEIEIPENVTQIGVYAFEQCYGLESLVLPEGLSTISSGLFNQCTSLKSVTIPASVTVIGTSAFNGCNSLADVYYGSNEKTWQKIEIGSYNTALDRATIHYTDPCLQGHTWKNADCVAPKSCTVCGETEGEALGHSWVDADCETAKTCSVCGETEGEALGHSWVDADCITAKTCSVCGETEGVALGHDWDDATCVAPKTCSVCGETEGAPLDHNWTPADCENPKTCTRCGATEGEVSGHTEVCGVCTACGIGLNLGDYQYTLDESAMTVTLTDYIGSGTDVHVAASYLLDGKEYRTLLEATSVFRGNTAITSVKIYDGVTVASNSMAEMFYGCASLKTADLTGLDTTGVTSLRRLFSECKKLTGVDVTGWDTSAVEDMSYLFDYCSALTTITGYENWNTGSLWNISKAFNRTTSIEKVDLSKWDLSKISNSGWCFQICYAEEILLPDNLAMMSAGFLNHPAKFAGSTFTIPSGVKKIGYAHTIYDFGTDAFTAFEVPAQNGYYKAVDGILYSEDGTELLAIPRGKTFENGVFEVPNTVTFMGELSFSRNYNIETLVLPDNYIIEYVPLYDSRYIIEDGHGGNDTGNLNSGTNLSIAIYCYTGITAYDVRETNTRYEAVEGVIYSEDMTTLVAVPARYAQHLNIPEGVTTWNKEAMWADHAGNSNLLSLLSSCTGVSIPSTLCEIDAEQLSMINRLADRTSSAFTITVSEGNRTFHVNPTTGHLETHTYSQEVTDPTCEDAGYTTHTCDVCGDNYKTDPVPAKNHDWAAADCITPKTCKVCGETEGEALGHSWVDADCVNPKTCTVCGETEGEALGHSWVDADCVNPKTCKVCGETEGAPLNHNWQDATCSAPETCTRCGETMGEALGHDWVDANCTAPKTCIRCNETEGEALGHNWLAATCIAPETCTGCGITRGEKFPHTPVVDAAVEATCTTTGLTEGQHCSACGEVLVAQQTVPTKNHTWKSATCTTPKTCTVCGKTEGEALGHNWVAADCDTAKTCSVCGATEGNPLGHTVVTDKAVEATCTATGLTEGQHCSVCGEVLVAQQTVPKKNHTWKSATCTTPQTCTVCGQTNGDAKGHDWKAATCTENAVCKRCGEVATGTKLPHAEAVVSAVAATCTTVGKTEGKYCTVCGTVTKAQQTIPALGHTEVIDPAVEATCTTIGKTEGSHCSVCGTVIAAQQTIHAKGHAAVPDAAVAATCTTPGKTSGSHCKTCGEVIMAQVVIPAAGHSWQDGNCYTPKTCNVCGVKEGGVVHAYEHRYDYKCDLCGVERIVDMTRPMVDMFRMYDPNSGEHFYTGSTVERDNLVAVGWQYEGVGFTFPLTTGDPVHRLYDPVYGEHLYTMDVEEMNELLAKGWNYEGIAFNSGFENEVPQYRLHNPNETRGAYHFTASIEERDHLISLGWEYQGIGWYSLGA